MMSPGAPRTKSTAKQELVRKLGELIEQVDRGAIAIRGHDGDGAAHNAERLRKHLERRIARLEESER
jgi:hypothetical protein